MQKRKRHPHSPTPSSSAPLPPLSPAKRWTFRILAILLPSLVLFGALEVILRVAGYGYPTSFFRKAIVQDQSVWVENEFFGWRFFPPQVSPVPSPVVMDTVKPANRLRIFLLGESAALGDPRPAYGMGRFLETLLRKRYPTVEFEIVCVAMTAINSHAILPIARECAGHDGDLWIVYMGNNEMLGAFGAQAPSLPIIRATLAIKRTRVGQLFTSLLRRLSARKEDGTWRGMQTFTEHQVPPDSAERAKVHHHFETNLEDIIQTGAAAEVPIILCTVASNLRDFAPLASLHGLPWDETELDRKEVWTNSFAKGIELRAEGDLSLSRAALHDAAEIDPKFAELQFQLGRCFLSLSNAPSALDSLTAARDYDALPFRTDSTMNRIIAEIAARHADADVQFLDLASHITEESVGGIPGWDWFLDHVHFTANANYRVAREMADSVVAQLSDRLPKPDSSGWATLDECAARLGLTDWNRAAAVQKMLERLSVPPFTHQSNHAAQVAHLEERLNQLRHRLAEADVAAAQALYEEVLAARPDDFRLRESYAEFLETTGQISAATEQWRTLADLLPHLFGPPYQLGRLLGRQGLDADAEPHLRAALAQRPDAVQILVELAENLVRQGRAEEAIPLLRRAETIQPGSATLQFQLANALAAAGHRPEAIDHLRQAIRLNPGYWQARYLLGVELAAEDQVPQAQAEFEQVVRLRPGFALGHLNLGVALAKQGRMDEAQAQFEQVLRLDPDSESARQHLSTIQSLRRRLSQ